MSPGPAKAAPAGSARLPVRAARGLRALVGVLGFLLLLTPAAGARELQPLRTPGSKQQYRAVAAAWEAKKPSGVVALMAPRGTVRLSLFTPSVSGAYKAAQAEKTLEHYFARVSDIDLKDVTDKDQRLPRGWAVRKYEYRYTPRGHDPVKTLLTITMRGDGRGTWTLDAIRETKLPERR